MNLISKIYKNFAGYNAISPRPFVVLGSSSSEVFDYIFGDREDYFPFWSSGWSARGLRSDEGKAYINKILMPIPRSANVFLNFGCVDTNFNCRHMSSTRGFYDFKRTICEAADGIKTAADIISNAGFKNIFATFISPAIQLPQNYWAKFNPSRQLPDRMLGCMYYDLFEIVSKSLPTIDIFNETSSGQAGGYLLKNQYKKSYHSHHPCYIKIQDLLWEKISGIPGIIPRRTDFFDKEYQHTPSNIKHLMESGTTRPRTCQ